jgi:malate dehydrogenase
LIAQRNAPDIDPRQFTAMTRLDHNRAMSQLANKTGTDVNAIRHMTIWGNHSNTQFPDFCNARIGGKLAPEVITDTAWLEGDFIKTVQERGAAIIKARGLSSAFSAAHAAIETVRSLANDTPSGDWHSVALCSDGSYGIEKGLICGFPTATNNGHASIVQGVPVNDFARARIDRTVDELKDEKAMVADLLPG